MEYVGIRILQLPDPTASLKCRNLEYKTQIRSKLGEDGIDSEEKVLLKKVADCVAKTELELTTYQQCEGIFTKANVVSNAKAMAPAQ